MKSSSIAIMLTGALYLVALPATAQIVGTKLWPYQDEVCPEGQPYCPYVINGASAPSGFPINPTFRKLQDATGLRCEFAADFIPGDADTTITESIIVDDGSKFGVGKGFFAQANQWTADFWSITFIKDVNGLPLPAGPHQVAIWLGTEGGQTLFYHQFALLECFEEALGVQQ